MVDPTMAAYDAESIRFEVYSLRLQAEAELLQARKYCQQAIADGCGEEDDQGQRG